MIFYYYFPLPSSADDTRIEREQWFRFRHVGFRFHGNDWERERERENDGLIYFNTDPNTNSDYTSSRWACTVFNERVVVFLWEEKTIRITSFRENGLSRVKISHDGVLTTISL